MNTDPVGVSTSDARPQLISLASLPFDGTSCRYEGVEIIGEPPGAVVFLLLESLS